MTRRIPRELERYPLGTKLDHAGADRWRATDRERGRDVTVTRVAFGPEQLTQRDQLVERARGLYTLASPALVAVYDAGAWDDDAFVVEELVTDPQPIGAMELDAREKALAARSIAEGVATLHEAGWSLETLDVVIDAYRQPKIAIAQHAVRATEEARLRDVDALRSLLADLAGVTTEAASASAIARAIPIPGAGPSSPLVHASAPSRSPVALALLALVFLALVALLLTRR